MSEISQLAPLSGNPAGQQDFVGMLRFVIKKMMQQTDDMLPAKVISYNRASNRAMVQPLITLLTTKNEIIERPPVASVPVLQLGGGGFVLSFPINPGDIGWIKANDRDISQFKQSFAMGAPPTQRKKTFADAVFIPDTMLRGVTINGEDAGNVTLQNLDGTCRVTIWGDRVKITAPQIVLDSPLTTITGEVRAGTNSSYTTTATFHGNIITDHDVIAQTVSLHDHTHNGVQPGGGNTGAPNT